jgi:hypothetical protein
MSLSFLCSGSSVRMIDDCLFCRCHGLSCVQDYPNRTPRTQERPRHLQNEQSSIILTELPEHKKNHDIYKTNNHLSSYQNSPNTRKTTTSTKQSIIYHPNITPRTQERSRHLQNKQSSVVFLVFRELG